MAKRTYKVSLSKASLKAIDEELKNLEKTLDKEIIASIKKMGKESLEYMQKQYQKSKNNMSNHIGNINLKPYNGNYRNGFVISSGNDIVAVFNEYGTGIVGAGTSKLANETGYDYNLPSPYKGVIPEGAKYQYTKQYLETVNTPNTWWYFKNGRWWHTEGMKGKNMYSKLRDKLKKEAIKDFETKVSQVIGNYNGR